MNKRQQRKLIQKYRYEFTMDRLTKEQLQRIAESELTKYKLSGYAKHWCKLTAAIDRYHFLVLMEHRVDDLTQLPAHRD